MSMEVRSPEDLYPIVEDLILRLKRDGATRLAAILDHRMHKVAWTTASELLEELRGVLSKADRKAEPLTEQTEAEFARVVAGIDSLLEVR
jgi:hypothetical protein